MLEAVKGFRRLKAHKQLPILRGALAAHQAKHAGNPHLEAHPYPLHPSGSAIAAPFDPL